MKSNKSSKNPIKKIKQKKRFFEKTKGRRRLLGDKHEDLPPESYFDKSNSDKSSSSKSSLWRRSFDEKDSDVRELWKGGIFTKG